jgi:hypothetical protein
MRSESHHGVQFQGLPEAALNQRVKNLIQKLGEALHESVSESEHIAGVVKNIRDQGFDVMLMLEATIGLNQVETESDADRALDSSSTDHLGPFTPNDLSFLKSLRITLPEADGHMEAEPTELRLDPPIDSAPGPQPGD